MITAVTQVYGQFMNAKTAFDQLFTVLDTHSTLVEKPNAVMPENFQRVLNSKMFHSLTLIHRRFKTSILKSKHTGQWRSSDGAAAADQLANLMIRFYDPSSGAILLDGHDLRDLPLRKYRDLFGVVLQDPFLLIQQ